MNFNDYLKLINEGLIKTYDINYTIKFTNQILTRYNINYNFNIDGDFLELVLNIKNLDSNLVKIIFDDIEKIVINTCGWFPMKMFIKYGGSEWFLYEDSLDNFNNKKYDSFKIIFSSKFGKIDTNVPEYLYHLSINEYKDSILKNGLSTKSKNKISNHCNRIYLCKRKEDCEFLMNNMKFYYYMERDKNIYLKGKKLYQKDINPVIFKIDNRNNYIKSLYVDPEYDRGYYIIDHIPPSLIELIF